jgi:protein arginine N-methyltransferase 3
MTVFAARAGAKHVYAIEASGLATKARENIANNGLSASISVIQGKVEDITLPVDKVDVIVSEWMVGLVLIMLTIGVHAALRINAGFSDKVRRC